MEIRQLVTFITVVQFGSFSKAAAELGYSQSAVTVQIRRLEEELNTRLLDRFNKQVIPTAQGRDFLVYSHNILQEMNKAKLSLADDKELCNPLHIGTLESICFAKLPSILHYFRSNHPKVSVSITNDSPETLIRMMERNQLDLIYILDEPRYDINWEKVMEHEEPIVFVGSPDFASDSGREYVLDDLLCEPFFLTEKDANYRHALDKHLASRNQTLSPSLESSDTEFILKMLRCNHGVSFLPYFSVKECAARRELTVLNVTDFKLSMYRQIFYHKDKWKTKEMEEFIRLAKEEADLT